MKMAGISFWLLLCLTVAANAQPKYIVIQKRLLWGFKVKHVEKPQKRLRKWAYDSTNDTYYRLKSSIGVCAKAVVGEMRTHPDYVYIKQGWTAWKISSVDKPKRNLKRWYLDKETGAHYRVRYYLGNAGRIW